MCHFYLIPTQNLTSSPILSTEQTISRWSLLLLRLSIYWRNSKSILHATSQIGEISFSTKKKLKFDKKKLNLR